MTADRLRLAIGGLGTVGREIARRALTHLDGYELTAVSATRHERAQRFLDEIGSNAELVSLDGAADKADVVIECAPAAHFEELARPVLENGKTLVVLSSAALVANWHLVELARKNGANILVPSGAFLGLDAVQAAAEGDIESVRMVTMKPPSGLRGSPYVMKEGIDLDKVTARECLFKGTASQVIDNFPANLNVAMSLALAGIGPDRTEIEVWVDPEATRNHHRVVVVSDAARLEFAVWNVPSSNPKTGLLTAQSVVALLRKSRATVRIGT